MANSQAILDWWTLRNYQPTPAIQNLAAATTLTTDGQKYFYVGEPELNAKQEFSQNCPNAEARESLILGCYNSGNIFLLEVERKELAKVMEVTAAHEMLHAAYDRLSSSERRRVEEMIRSFYRTLKDDHIAQLVEIYERTEPGQLINELHSILPTELPKLSDELEAYYGRYFRDRSRVVAAFKAYEGVFTNIEDRRDQLVAEIDNLKQQIDNLSAQQAAAAAEARRLADEISRLRAQGDIEESNALVPAQNAAAAEANSLAGQVQSRISLHNAKVEQVNKLALLQNDLVGSLDSSNYAQD